MTDTELALAYGRSVLKLNDPPSSPKKYCSQTFVFGGLLVAISITAFPVEPRARLLVVSNFAPVAVIAAALLLSVIVTLTAVPVFIAVVPTIVSHAEYPDGMSDWISAAVVLMRALHPVPDAFCSHKPKRSACVPSDDKSKPVTDAIFVLVLDPSHHSLFLL